MRPFTGVVVWCAAVALICVLAVGYVRDAAPAPDTEPVAEIGGPKAAGRGTGPSAVGPSSTAE